MIESDRTLPSIKRVPMQFVRVVLLCLLCFSLSGCLEDKLPPGLVGMVNGEAITLREVEALQDVSGAGLAFMDMAELAELSQPGGTPTLRPEVRNEAVENLRRQYGSTLAVLVVQKLVRQYLERKGFAVSPQELAAAEQEVRADYPDDEFQKTLQDEFVDEETWRSFLLLRLSMLRFQEQVLRPRVSLTTEEVEASYAERKADFKLPARVVVDVYAGVEEAQMEAVRTALSNGSPIALPQYLTRQTLRLPLERLIPQWRQDVRGLEVNKSTPVREVDGLFQFLVLKEQLPAQTLDIVAAYSLIESQLVEDKLPALFDEWLKETLSHSEVQLARALIPGK